VQVKLVALLKEKTESVEDDAHVAKLNGLIKSCQVRVKSLKGRICGLGNNLAQDATRGFTESIEADPFSTRQDKPERNAFGAARLNLVNMKGACSHFALEIKESVHMNVVAMVQMLAVETEEKECVGVLST